MKAEDKVKHAQYGIGTIVRKTSTMVQGRPTALVDFESVGPKAMVTEFLELIKQ